MFFLRWSPQDLEEAELLHGSRLVCEEMKNLLLEHGIPRRLDELERQAAAERELARLSC